MLGLIPAVLVSDIDKNFSKVGMMEGTVFVMLRLMKMVQTPDKDDSDKEWKDHGDD
jgi:hypothetical protein